MIHVDLRTFLKGSIYPSHKQARKVKQEVPSTLKVCSFTLVTREAMKSSLPYCLDMIADLNKKIYMDYIELMAHSVKLS